MPTEYETEKYDKTMKTLEQIAQFKEWSFEPYLTDYKCDPVRAYIKKDNMKLFLYANGYRNQNRIEISGIYPADYDGNIYRSYTYGEELPKISVSLNKSPNKIWKDIETRLMPEYLRHLAQAHERLENTTKSHNSRNKIEKELSQLFNEPLKKQSNADPYNFHNYLETSYEYSRIDAKANYSGEYIKVSFELSPKDAFPIIKEILKYRKK